MGTYILSTANRFYAALEQNYGAAASVTAANRFPAVSLQSHQAVQVGKRQDKTGTRTYLGAFPGARRITAFEVKTYLTSWSGVGEPVYGPLLRASLGAAPQLASGLSVASVESGTLIQTTAPHGLSTGSAISSGPEIRFVTAVTNTVTFSINAPFITTPVANQVLAPAITYSLSTVLPSITLYDYWDPVSAVSRMITGASVDTAEILVNGDYHEFSFSGPARDLLDSFSFVTGAAGLSVFPVEPALAAFDYSIVPGNLGQVWLGAPASQFYTLTQASIGIRNNLEVRSEEFGSSYPQALAPGRREVVSNFTLYAQDDTQTESLYAAAKLRTQVSAMFQLGQQPGQIMGIFMQSVTPEIPGYDDSETRLLWQFKNNLAQGVSNDEIFIAFA